MDEMLHAEPTCQEFFAPGHLTASFAVYSKDAKPDRPACTLREKNVQVGLAGFRFCYDIDSKVRKSKSVIGMHQDCSDVGSVNFAVLSYIGAEHQTNG